MRRNILLRVLDIVLVLLTVVGAVSLVLALLAQYVSPQSSSFFAFFALAAPIIYLVCILLFVVWVVRWQRIFMLILAVPLSLGLVGVGDFIQIKWTENHRVVGRNNGEMTIISYNSHYMGQYRNGDNYLTEICDTLYKLDADVVCFQEFCVRDSAELSIIDKLFDRYTYRVYENDPTKSLSGYSGQVIISKFPLLEKEVFNFSGSKAGFLATQMVHNGDTIKLFNCHLQTTGFNQISKEKGMMTIIESDSTQAQSKKIIEQMSLNFKLRSLQADTVKMEINKYSGNVIVTGDFNSPPLTYSYRTISDGLNDAFRSGGSGYGSTFRGLGGLFRIDYILFSDVYQCMTYDAPSWIYSDHCPVIVRLQKNNK